MSLSAIHMQFKYLYWLYFNKYKIPHNPVTSANSTGDRLPFGDDVVCRDAFRCILLSQTYTALSSRRATYATSRHI